MKRTALFALIAVLFPIPAKALKSNEDDTHLLKVEKFPGAQVTHSHGRDRDRPRLKMKRTVTNGAETKTLKDSPDRRDNGTEITARAGQIEEQTSGAAAPDLKLLQVFDPEWSAGFQAPNVVVPDIIMDLYESVQNETYKNPGREADLVRCLRLTDYVTVSFGVIIRFAFNHSRAGERLVGAELYLHRSVQSPLTKHHANFTILRLYKVEARAQISHEISERNADVHQLLAVIYLAPYAEGWQILNIEKSLGGTKIEGDSLEFLVTASDIRGRAKNPKWFGLNILDKVNFPFLAVKYRQPTNDLINPVRNKVIYTEKEGTTQCVLNPFYLSFQTDSFTRFIIRPRGVMLNKCIGSCELQWHNHFANHAKLLKVLNGLIGKTYKVCCVPEQYSPLTIMFWNQDSNIVIKKYYNAVVNSCVCK